MQKLNSPANRSYPYFIVFIVCALILIARARSGDIGGFVDGVVTLVFVGSFFIGIGVFIGNVIFRLRQTVALNTLPPPVVAVRRDTHRFHRNNLPTAPPDPPIISKDIFDYLSNDQNVSAYLETLASTKLSIDTALTHAITHYSSDRGRLEDQQIGLYRMAHLAGRIVQTVSRRFPRISANLASVPSVKALRVPTRPTIMTPTDYANRFIHLRGAGHIGARLVSSGNANPLTLGLLLVGTAAMSVVQFQRAVREMHEAAGAVCDYLDAAGDELDMLGRAHEELVAVSEGIVTQSAELRGLIQNGRERLRQPFELDAPTESLFKRLAAYALLSRLKTSTAI